MNAYVVLVRKYYEQEVIKVFLEKPTPEQETECLMEWAGEAGREHVEYKVSVQEIELDTRIVLERNEHYAGTSHALETLINFYEGHALS